MPEFIVHHGDCLAVLKTLPDNSVDSIVTDPPAGIAFMNAEWDEDKGGRDEWIAWLTTIMAEAKRVLKPGGHALVWSLPRTSHWTGMACENAGFTPRDVIHHIFGSGFPKNHNIANHFTDVDINSVTGADLAKQWDGWGTALKPAAENWWLLRKPLEGTVATNIVKYGVGGINIDGCRIGASKEIPGGRARTAPQGAAYGDLSKQSGDTTGWDPNIGRWPSNVILSPEAADELDAAVGVRTSGMMKPGQQRKATLGKGGYGDGFPDEATATGTYGDSGGVSRYFYCPKASRSEREAGLDYFPSRNVNDGRETSIDNPYQRGDTVRKNTHPTSKSLELMQYLVRLITPKGGTVLDPFTGSGSTGCAAMLEGMNFIGIEREAEFVDIARARIAYWGNHKPPELLTVATPQTPIIPVTDDDIL